MFKSHYSNPLDPKAQDVLIIRGIFFIRTKAIQDNATVAKETLKDVYKHIHHN